MPKKSLKPSTYLYPAPVLLITAREGSGKPHAATICWAGVLCSEPPLLGISVRPSRHLNTLIRDTGEFVINIPSRRMLQKTDYCGFSSLTDTDKFATAGFTAEAADKVKAPLIKECLINLECVVRQVLPLGTHDHFIAEVVSAHADDEVLEGDDIRMEKLSPFVYCPIIHEYRAVGEKIGTYGFSTPGAVVPRPDDAQRIIGTWRLVSIEGGALRQYRGESPEGLLCYDDKGRMAVQIMPDRDRSAYAGALPTSEEARDALLGYTAYFGSYSLDEQKRTITHHRTGNIHPGKPGDVVRRYDFISDDRLALMPVESSARFIWERIR